MSKEGGQGWLCKSIYNLKFRENYKVDMDKYSLYELTVLARMVNIFILVL